MVKELIDTLWNVNIMDGKYFSVIKKELIDTLWNVNTYMLMMSDARTSELIDTLWNVNVKKLGRIVRGVLN